jgi:hypothetical protein
MRIRDFVDIHTILSAIVSFLLSWPPLMKILATARLITVMTKKSWTQWTGRIYRGLRRTAIVVMFEIDGGNGIVG